MSLEDSWRREEIIVLELPLKDYLVKPKLLRPLKPPTKLLWLLPKEQNHEGVLWTYIQNRFIRIPKHCFHCIKNEFHPS